MFTWYSTRIVWNLIVLNICLLFLRPFYKRKRILIFWVKAQPLSHLYKNSWIKRFGCMQEKVVKIWSIHGLCYRFQVELTLCPLTLTFTRHFSANGCLMPLCAVDGMAVTTVEGIGSTKTVLHPVQVNNLLFITI